MALDLTYFDAAREELGDAITDAQAKLATALEEISITIDELGEAEIGSGLGQLIDQVQAVLDGFAEVLRENLPTSEAIEEGEPVDVPGEQTP